MGNEDVVMMTDDEGLIDEKVLDAEEDGVGAGEGDNDESDADDVDVFVDDEGNAEDDDAGGEVDNVDAGREVVGEIVIGADEDEEKVSEVELENDSEEDVEPASVEEELKVDVGNEDVVSDDDDDNEEEDDLVVEEEEEGSSELLFDVLLLVLEDEVKLDSEELDNVEVEGESEVVVDLEEELLPKDSKKKWKESKEGSKRNFANIRS